ncbi:MAG: glycosyltransferase family 2 protein [Geobacteraceae bacterium]|nr:glycosyltransferase family 2 protein [Geobacteraceae bacterium]
MTYLSIVIPVYNAEKTIANLCRDLITLLGLRYRLEIVLVNDCSRDNSGIICREIHAEFPDVVTCISLSRNFSEHNAVMAGLHHANGEYIVIMDDDFQNPPDEVSTLVAEIEKGFDVVYCHYSEKKDSIFRNFGSYLNGSMARVVLSIPANLYLSSFKVINRFLRDEIIKFSGPHPYLDAIILRTTRNISSVLVRHDERRSGRSGYTFKKLVSLWGNMIVSCSLIPLRIIGISGAALTVLGLYSVASAMVRDLLPMLADPSDLEKMASVTMFFRGFQLVATSIVGEYVGRIYMKLNSEPQFIIRDMCQATTNGGSEHRD